jgi:hypothetical protein
MKKLLVAFFYFLLCLSLYSQKAFVETSLVVNVEVPVRVFEGNEFVNDLTLGDFQILEDGIPQKIEAVHLVKNKSVLRSEGKEKFVPETSRSFFLFFEISQYSPKLEETIDYFFQNVFLPGDDLIFVSPLKTYQLKEIALYAKSKAEIREEMKELLRKDTVAGNSEYYNLVHDLANTIKDFKRISHLETDRPYLQHSQNIKIEFEEKAMMEEVVMSYADILSRLENLRKIDELKLLDFAKFLKTKEGQKYIYLFYEREFLPRIDPDDLDQAISEHLRYQRNFQQTYPDIQSLARGGITFDVDRVKQAYADSSVSVHFLFITNPPIHMPGISMEERSDDIYGAFKEMARATGGFIMSSSNPAVLLQEALKASESYYLLYYRPKNYSIDGKFKAIKVRVKNKNYKVLHRQGYIAE